MLRSTSASIKSLMTKVNLAGNKLTAFFLNILSLFFSSHTSYGVGRAFPPLAGDPGSGGGTPEALSLPGGEPPLQERNITKSM